MSSLGQWAATRGNVAEGHSGQERAAGPCHPPGCRNQRRMVFGNPFDQPVRDFPPIVELLEGVERVQAFRQGKWLL